MRIFCSEGHEITQLKAAARRLGCGCPVPVDRGLAVSATQIAVLRELSIYSADSDILELSGSADGATIYAASGDRVFSIDREGNTETHERAD